MFTIRGEFKEIPDDTNIPIQEAQALSLDGLPDYTPTRQLVREGIIDTMITLGIIKAGPENQEKITGNK